jgi:hypothetical protein
VRLSKPKKQLFKSRLITYELENTKNFKDIKQFLDSLETIVNVKIIKELANKELKFNIAVFAEYKRGTEEYQEINFKTQNEIIKKPLILPSFILQPKTKFYLKWKRLKSKVLNESLTEFLKMELRINKYNPLRGSSYVPLSKVLAHKKAIKNVKNEDNKCFLWSILSAFHPADKRSYRVSKYKKLENEFDEALHGIEYPVKLDVSKFVRRKNISINVY